MNAPGKEKEREETLNTQLADLLGFDVKSGDCDKYVDLTITCIRKGDD